ncbi:MAG TPA: hypothetical protein VH228_04795 [Nocardioides sp.]|nr:hypothetical protein [Nocardioides sp.]
MPRRLGPAFLALAVTLPLLAGCGGGTSSAPEAGSTATSPTASAGKSSGGKFEATPHDFRAVARVLERRAKAVRAHDLGAFMATVDRSNPALVGQQRTLYSNLSQLSLASLRYEMDNSAALVPARIRGHDPVLHPQITEFLQLSGSLGRPVTNSVNETFVRRGDRWLVAAEPANGTSGTGVQWRPWAGTPIAVRRSDAMTVIVDRSRASTLPSLTQAVHDDIAFDASQLGVPASYQVVVDATSSGGATKFSSLSKEEAAAVTFGLVAGTRDMPDTGGRLAGLAIKVNPHDAARLTESTPILRHELTHYLLRRYNGSSPKWLTEGIATWIQYYPDTFSALAVSPALYSKLDHAERTLPSIGLFDDAPDVNYIVSQAAVAWLVSHYGMPRLIALMRAYRDNFHDVNSDAITGRMLRQVYGVTQQQVVAGAFGLIGELHH